jgi:hypothetical protein
MDLFSFIIIVVLLISALDKLDKIYNELKK